MNKKSIFILILCRFLLLSLCAQTIREKSFEKGAMVIEPGIGLGLYKTTFTDKSFTPPLSGNDTAGAVLYPLGFEYGVLDWLGCGGKFNYSNYIEGDSASAEKGSGIDFGAFIRAHALRTKRIDMFAGFDFGYSHFVYDANDGSGGVARGGGTFFSFNLNSRFYFGKKWGMRLFYNFDSYNYPNIAIEDSFGNSADFSLKSKSFFLLGAGFMFKL